MAPAIVDPIRFFAMFSSTMRAVLDPGGQRVSALDRLYLTEALPSLLVWGENDPIIPAEHGRAAHGAMPGSRLELLPGVGHFPQLESPYEFAALLSEFIAETVPAELDTETMRERLWARVNAKAKPLRGVNVKPGTQWLKPGLVGRVRHLKGEQLLRHATLREIKEK